MKPTAFLTALLALLFAGCESMPDRFETVPPEVQVMDGAVEEVHAAAQKAFRRLDLKVIRAPMGRVEAASAINTSETFGDSRQIVARVKITQAEPGRASVELTVTEEVGSSSMGGTRQRALREHSLFQLYFTTLQQVLKERAEGRAAEKN
jgi:hypothetical protein